MRLEITEDCCAVARQLIADGLNPAEVLEFYRGDMLSLRGTAQAFAKRTVREDDRIGPVHVPWKPLDPDVKAALRRDHRRQERV